MRVLSDKDYKLLEKLVSLTEKEMVQAMNQYLRAKYNNVITTKDYIIAIGDIPIALVAHMDTVFKFPVSDLYYIMTYAKVCCGVQRVLAQMTEPVFLQSSRFYNLVCAPL